MATALLISRILLAATFALAAAGKLLDRAGTRSALGDFGVPSGVAPVGALLLPLAETAVAALLIGPPTARPGAILALVLLASFAVAIVRARQRGRAPDCHCFGAIHSAPAGPATLVRIGVLGALGAFVVAAGPGRSVADALGGVDLGAVAIVVAFAALSAFSVQLLRQHGRLLERVRVLEEGASGHSPTTRAPAGLPIGTPAPAFALTGLDGTPRSLTELLAPGRTLALAFSEPDCPACAAVPPALARLQAERDGELDVVLISRGSPAENVAKLGADRLATVLLQSEREVAVQFNVASVPSAFTIAPDGRVSSRLAVGLVAIEELLAGGPPAGGQIPDHLAVMHR